METGRIPYQIDCGFASANQCKICLSMAVVSPVTRSQGTISMWIFVSLIAEILHNIFALLTILPIFASLAVVPVSLA